MAKYCSKCTTNKDYAEFNRRSDGPGLRAHCKQCLSKENSARSAAKCNRRTKKSEEDRRKAQTEASKRFRAKTEYKVTNAVMNARRRADKLNATPKWLSKEQLAHIKCYYETARHLSEVWNLQMDVDHIIPLKGKIVCGLHVPWNLQVMEHKANISKSNKVDYE